MHAFDPATPCKRYWDVRFKRMIKQKTFRFTLIEALIIVAIIVVLAALILPYMAKKREEAIRVKCSNNLKQIALSLNAYWNCAGGGLPKDNGRLGLQTLADSGFLDNTQCYTCPNTKDIVYTKSDVSVNASYAYASGLSEIEPPPVGRAMASDRAYNHNNFGNILFFDNHVKGYSGANWSSNFGGSVLGDFK